MGTIWQDLSKLPQRRQDPDPCPLLLLVGFPSTLLNWLPDERSIAYPGGCRYIFFILFLLPLKSPRAHVAKFYGLRSNYVDLYRFGTSKFSIKNRLKLSIYGFLTILLASAYFCILGITFNFLITLLAKDRWWGVSTRNAHMFNIVLLFYPI